MSSVNDQAIDIIAVSGLRPITSLDNGRYDKQSYANSNSVVLAAGIQAPVPQYLPSQWTAYTHPEGQLYFHRSSTLKVTTDAYLYSPETLGKVLCWTKTIEAMLEEMKIPFSESIELFLLLENDGCAYYFIDHASRSQFWLHNLSSEELGIPDVDSPSHLNLYLEFLYWIHVEHFPMHFGGFPMKTVDDLLSVYSHGLTDQLTSQTSTFFYTSNECSQFIKILKLARQNSTDGHQVCVIARLWRQVCDNRFQTHYGQEISRLNRNQAIVYDSPQSSRISTAARYFTFGASDVYLAKLSDLFVDRLVYFSQWQPFIRRCLRVWKRSFWAAFAIIMLHSFLFLIESSQLLAIMSASFSFASLLISATLVHRYDRLESDDACAHDVYAHLEGIRSSKYDFQFVALSYALPSSLQLWALVILGLNAILALGNVFGLRLAIGCGISVIVLLAWVLRITSQTSWNIRVPQIFHREKAEHEMV